jgi:hypothetical protein
LRDLGGIDLEHVAGRGLFDEILRRGADAERRIDAGLFTDGLDRRRGRGEERRDGRGDG